MRRSEKFANPFYILVVLAGLSFALTALAYGVMVVRANAAVRTATEAEMPRRHPLMEWMKQHGEAALLCELGLLAVGAFGAIATDEFWQRRAAAQRKSRQSKSTM
jgi:hypothetical protein